MKQLYRLCFIDATIIDQDEREIADANDESLEHLIAKRFDQLVSVEDIDVTDDRDGDWVDFGAAIRFWATPESVKDEAEKVIEEEGRIIEVFTVLDMKGEIILTEEAYV